MGTVFKKTFTKPLPRGAETFEEERKRYARWKPPKGRTRTARVTRGANGRERVLIKAATYTARFRDGQGRLVERPTGCRDEGAARAVLGDLERRAELVRAGVLTPSQDAVSEHQAVPITEHLEAYLKSFARQAEAFSARTRNAYSSSVIAF